MNKGELIDMVAAEAEASKKDADASETAMVEATMEAIDRGEKVSLVGFSSFKSPEWKAWRGCNPQTSEALKIAVTTVPVFS